MNGEKHASINKQYIAVVSTLTFVLPLVGAAAGAMFNHTVFSFALLAKWFIFWAVGIRLFLAGIRQTTHPDFTAKEIFHIDSPHCLPVVRELGFANCCFGLIGIISLFLPQWRIVSAFGSGLYYGMAALLHLLKRPAGANEMFALITDIVIFIFLLVYFVVMFS